MEKKRDNKKRRTNIWHIIGLSAGWGSLFVMLFNIFLPVLISNNIDSPNLIYLNLFHEFWVELIMLIIGFFSFTDYLMGLWMLPKLKKQWQRIKKRLSV